MDQENKDIQVEQTPEPAIETGASAPKQKKLPVKWIIICAAVVLVVALLTVGGYFAVTEIGVQGKIGEVNAVVSAFEDGQRDYADSVALLQDYKKHDDRRVRDAVTDVQSKLDELKDSTESYYNALILEENEDWLNASLEFLKVKEISKNYASAQSRIAELEERAEQQVEETIPGLVENKDYDGAIGLLVDLDSVYKKDAHTERINALKEERTSYQAAKKAEEERIAAEKKAAEEAERARKAQEERDKAASALQISRCWVGSRDSAGGYPLHINFVNKSSKTIKYFHFGVTFYDPVGEPIETWRIHKIEKCTATGPFEPWGGMSGSNQYWGKYYDSWIDHPEIVYVRVEYMDGTTWKLNANELAAVQY